MQFSEHPGTMTIVDNVTTKFCARRSFKTRFTGFTCFPLRRSEMADNDHGASSPNVLFPPSIVSQRLKHTVPCEQASKAAASASSLKASQVLAASPVSCAPLADEPERATALPGLESGSHFLAVTGTHLKSPEQPNTAFGASSAGNGTASDIADNAGGFPALSASDAMRPGAHRRRRHRPAR